MAQEIFFTRDLLGNLHPADAESKAAILEMRVGKTYRADVVLPRNYDRLKWWWKLCEIISENGDRWPSSRSASDMLKLKTGHFDTVVVPGKKAGEWVQQYSPRSIAFNSMEEPAFKALCNEAVRVAAEVLSCDSAQLNEALGEFFTGGRAASRGVVIEERVDG